MRSKLTKPSSSRSNGFFANSGKKSSNGIQAKLKANKPGDQYEVEADKTADHVVGQSMGSVLSSKSTSPGADFGKPLPVTIRPNVSSSAQRKEEDVQTKEAENESEELDVQMKEPETAESGMSERYIGEEDPILAQAIQMKEDENVQLQEGDNESEETLSTSMNTEGNEIRGVELKSKNDSEELNNSPKKNISVEFNAFIPNVLEAPWYQFEEAWKWEPGLSSNLFASDNRSYKEDGSSRISHESTFTIDSKGKILTNNFSVVIGKSKQATPIREKIWVPPHPTKDFIGGYFREGKVIGLSDIRSKTAANKGNNSFTRIDESNGKNEYEFNMRGEASYPFSILSPDIDFDINFLVGTHRIGDSIYIILGIVGTHDNFPAYEGIIKIDNKNTYIYSDKVEKDAGPGLLNLNSSKIFSTKSSSFNLSK